MFRIACAVALGAIVLGTATLAAPAEADARPRVSSFYAKDQGRYVMMRVRFCDPAGVRRDPYTATFRMWRERGARRPVLVAQRRVSLRIGGRCGYLWVRLPDAYRAGRHSANVGVSNRRTKAFTRIGVRYLAIR